ncbi:hypothetical protein BaRGS_00017883 [Batillaria attramentaria]|uniref:Uncharacterized protein n=1 Tax=Batillaria attramentaria TaxID=370345 RepID=A0ABD0KVN1_9CAEN
MAFTHLPTHVHRDLTVMHDCTQTPLAPRQKVCLCVRLEERLSGNTDTCRTAMFRKIGEVHQTQTYDALHFCCWDFHVGVSSVSINL